jgi:S-adenosylmethionine:tRNA ribosyltransferase-isomerase
VTPAAGAASPTFTIPPAGEAAAPPEARGLARDQVRLLVAGPGRVEHRAFRDLPDVLRAGDLLVLNTSATLPAALDGRRGDGRPALVHVSGTLDDGDWVVELRRPDNRGPAGDVGPGEWLRLPGRVSLHLREAYPDPTAQGARLWRGAVTPSPPVAGYLSRHGRPIRYGYVRGEWPLSALQNVYADTPGSAEMPSAGRPFTHPLLSRLMARGVTVAPLLLHTGVSSQEAHEAPLPEWYAVPASTARLVTCARAAGHRVLAVGTTVVRALETVADDTGGVRAGEGWTDLVLGPDRRARVVDGMVTGLHPPQASHLRLLEAVVGTDVVAAAYREAVDRGYLWHEFGDSMLLTAWDEHVDEAGRARMTRIG